MFLDIKKPMMVLLAKDNRNHLLQMMQDSKCFLWLYDNMASVGHDQAKLYVYILRDFEYLIEEEELNLLKNLAQTIAEFDGVEIIDVEIKFMTLYSLEESIPFINSPLSVARFSIFGMPSDKPQFKSDIFVIMPFEDTFDKFYSVVIKPKVEQLNLSIKRGDDPFSKHDIMFEVWSMINCCRAIIADCTGLNPNVLYELGLAHAIGKPVILITQNIKELPFDIQNKRAIEYSTSFDKVDAFKMQLGAAIFEILKR